MRECRGPVLFDEKMAGPRKCVSGYEGQRKQPPFATGNHPDEKRYGYQGAKTMHYSSGRLAVLAQIVRPEIGKRFELPFIHGNAQPCPELLHSPDASGLRRILT